MIEDFIGTKAFIEKSGKGTRVTVTALWELIVKEFCFVFNHVR